MLVDTGSSINLISKDYVYNNKSKFKIYKEKFTFTTATGKHSGNEYIILNIENQGIKCYLHNFHKQFNVLLGIPAITQLKIILNFSNNSIKIFNKLFRLQYFETKNTINSNEINETKIRLEHLNEEEKREIIKVIKEFSCIFPKENDVLTHTSTIKHEIKTTDEIPTYTKSYRYPECYKEEISNQVDKLLKDKIIQESHSPWSSPVWMVPKKLDASGKRKFRMVIDYRKVNSKTIDDKFPISNITDVLDKLGKMFTTLL